MALIIIMEPCDGELHPNEPLNQGQRPQINIVNLNWDAIGREGGTLFYYHPMWVLGNQIVINIVPQTFG